MQVRLTCVGHQLCQNSCPLPLQEISDDLGRHRSDAQVNNTPCTVLRGPDEVVTQWHKLQVGDLIKVCIDTASGCEKLHARYT